MDIIHVMDDTLANKIAAGEVVERPASIVKELVENAIDAGSTVIEITLEEAGLTSIRVTDNGRGMSRQDAVRAFERHATSKISNDHDLFRIRTLGFRGEALASIASVSKISLWTSDGETTGTEVQIDGGEVILHQDAAFRKGTDITVSQLFFNTPARLKYMKTIQTELGHIIDLVNRLALSHPAISFKLSHASQVLLQTSGSGDQRRVVADIYGMAVARKMVPFSAENADYSASGFVSLPEITRASRNYMTLIVNGRWVKSHAMTHAILDAFHTYLPIGRFPIAVVNVKGDPFLTDVNVHPSKQQIRMSKEGELLTLTTQAIRQAIQKSTIIPDAIKKTAPPKLRTEQVNIWHSMQQEKSAPTFSNEAVQKQPQVVREEEVQVEIDDPQPRETKLPAEASIVQDPPPIEPAIATEKELTPDPPAKSFPLLVPVGQVHGTYIVAQNEDGFYMIDQHAAQERIKYEFFREKLSTPNHEERQLLLMPLLFHYSASDQVKIEERKEQLHEVGIFLEPFGPSTYTVKEYPSWFPAGEEAPIIEEVIEQVLNDRKIDIGKLREEAAILMSCKRSIKANHHLTIADMERLLNDLAQADNPFTCPHGRPVLIHFSTYEIEKMFKRVM
ncbi:DNA mismatch repair endonuclease MutL [Sporosarcina sp. HYO08]|uniref:DNA mismatch repair endonuclease MutL n=1 Tax=Sporosarcina sp. HYO08 TaxID=1759557 RepID=UPI00079A474C|nr:DNA mismatch repair endonuclease MutL [Sporosarcina sp. HYO08]KXH80056.1 DNA mismatch repair protein MutL [Sporosarcina sp. HYO08]